MKINRMKDVLESIAHNAVPEDINLMPGIAVRLERRPFMITLRAKPVLMILLVLLALTLLSGVVYAIGKSMGYIPGIGLIDQSTPLRMLSEPVTITRDGITLTVEQVVISADKTVVIYKMEGIPANAYESDNQTNESENTVSSYSSSITIPLDGTTEAPSVDSESKAICFSDEKIVLPNGTTLPLQTGEGNGWSSGFESRHIFGTIPAEIDDAAFLISCIPETEPGILPENWEVTLHFVPVPSDINILPAADVRLLPSGKSQSAMTFEKVIETNDGYILVGKFRSIGLPEYALAYGERKFLKITDANGQLIKSTHANGIDIDSQFGEFGLAYEIKGKQHAWPLTLTLDEVVVQFNGQSIEFEFDTGPNPQVGQEWLLHPDVQLMGYTIHDVLIERTERGYTFTIQSAPDVLMVSPEIKDFPYSSAGGSGDGFGKGETYFHIEYKGEPPSGKLVIKLSDLLARLHGPWYIQWQPENNSSPK
ncbi:MAG: hypothetical protein QM730_04390 [Anaerolineales bacterium]